MLSTPVIIASAPSNTQVGARLARMTDELAYAWDRTNQRVVANWAAEVAGYFVDALGRRTKNAGKLVARVIVFNVDEVTGAAKAHSQGRFKEHVKARSHAARVFLQGLLTKSKDAGAELIEALRTNPRMVGPQLLVMVVSSIVVSGGPDGDGGAPDLDLLGGIGAHRSIWTHSILMGTTLETGFLALVRLVHLVQENLPTQHDPKWDELAFRAQNILSAANKGASIGLAYHFLVDGLLQPGTYHGIPVPLPQEVHEVLQVLNGVAEGQDVGYKDWMATAPIWVRGGAKHWPWSQPGYVPARSRNPEDHHRERRTRFLVDEHTRCSLSSEELGVLEKYGTWMEGLTSGRLAPLTPGQEKFVRVAWGLAPLTTSHEKAWTMYLSMRYIS